MRIGDRVTARLMKYSTPDASGVLYKIREEGAGPFPHPKRTHGVRPDRRYLGRYPFLWCDPDDLEPEAPPVLSQEQPRALHENHTGGSTHE